MSVTGSTTRPCFAPGSGSSRAGQDRSPSPGTSDWLLSLDPALGRLLDADVPLYGGLDDVKLTGGVLADAERRAAELWGADWCRFSTGGSTHANQAVCLALGRPGDIVIVLEDGPSEHAAGTRGRGPGARLGAAGARSAHRRSHGAGPRALHAALTSHPNAAAVLCVEPSYLGAVRLCGAIVALAHERDVPVVVDQAWGAHLGFAPGYPDHALAGDADVLVTSAHKALPAFSQAALVLARTLASTETDLSAASRPRTRRARRARSWRASTRRGRSWRRRTAATCWWPWRRPLAASDARLLITVWPPSRPATSRAAGSTPRSW